MIAGLTGAAVIGGEFLLTGCKNDGSIGGAVFTADDIAFLDEVADTILPPTKSPGAKAANVGTFMTVMVNDCYTASDQKIFHEGIKKLNDLSDKKFNKGFVAATPEQRHELLVELDKDSRAYTKKTNEYFETLPSDPKPPVTERRTASTDPKDPKADKMREYPDYYYIMLKQLTLLGYFTSKEGATKALRYEAVPGKYDGNFPYKKGDRAWAT